MYVRNNIINKGEIYIFIYCYLIFTFFFLFLKKKILAYIWPIKKAKSTINTHYLLYKNITAGFSLYLLKS